MLNSVCTKLGVMTPVGRCPGPVYQELMKRGSLLPPLPRPALGRAALRSPPLSRAYDLINVICLVSGLCVRDGRKLKTLPIKLQRCNLTNISSSVKRGCGPLFWRISRLEKLAVMGRVKNLGFVVQRREALEVTRQ